LLRKDHRALSRGFSISPSIANLSVRFRVLNSSGSKNRRALVIAGDDLSAKATVTDLLDQFGFDTVDAGPLKEGWRIQRDTPGYGPRRTAEELRRDLAAAERYA
jgi:predicted dinucleotide-binding enzyme